MAQAVETCLHCGNNSSQGSFCCAGCARAYDLRHVLPLHINKPLEASPAQDVSRFVRTELGNTHALELMVEGMRCASCAFLIEDTLNHVPQVSARVNVTTRRLVVRWAGPSGLANELIEKVALLGYKLMPFDADKLNMADKLEEMFLLKCLAVAGFASGNIMMLSVGLWASTPEIMGVVTRDFLHWLSCLIAIPAVIFSGRPFFYSAWGALRHLRTNMDVPISVALALTISMSLFETIHHGSYAYFDSAVMLLFLLLIGRYLDRRTRGRARAAAQELLMMMAGTATVIENGAMVLLPLGELRAGMLLHVAAGEKISADGIVESGQSEVDPSFVSGEVATLFVDKGSHVVGGMVNLLSSICVRLRASVSESLVGEVVRLMETAEQGHASYVRIADRAARLYTPVVHTLAFAAFLGWVFVAGRPWQVSLLIATTVLIITCPCALGLAVPAVQVIASGKMFKQGMLLKSADALERMADVNTIIFDKTGTLTKGTPRLANARSLERSQLQLAASLAARSKHPLARAICESFDGQLQDLEVTEVAGRGLEAYSHGKRIRLGKREWCGVLDADAGASPETWLESEGEHPVRFVFADELREDASEVVRELRKRGYALSILSGGLEPSVAAIAEELGIADYQFSLSPIDKANAIASLSRSRRKVMMIGDGLNDAAALSCAAVSMSPSSALDVAQTAADIVFQGQSLKPVLAALDIAAKARTIVKENFVFALVYNLIAIPIALLGFVTPLIAALAMAGSSIFVVLNAQRVSR